MNRILIISFFYILFLFIPIYSFGTKIDLKFIVNNNFEELTKIEKIEYLKKQIKIISKIIEKKIIERNKKEVLKNKNNAIFHYPYFEKDLKYKEYKPILGEHWQKGSAKWAYDIPLASSSKIKSSFSGVVKYIKEDSEEYGCSQKYNGKANYIVIEHKKEKKETLYLHLKKKSVSKYKIKIGDKVRKGQIIGEVGKSGFVCGEHLHFQIQKQCKFWWCESLPVKIE